MEFEPQLVIFSGASFTGKTTLSQELDKRSNFVHLDVDSYRLEILGHTQSLPDEQEAEIMVEAYTRMHTRGLEVIESGLPVSFAATYYRPIYKPLLSDSLARIDAPVTIFELTVDDTLISERIEKRIREGNPSDIKTYEQYLAMKNGFEPITFHPRIFVDTSPGFEETVQKILSSIDNFRRE